MRTILQKLVLWLMAIGRTLLKKTGPWLMVMGALVIILSLQWKLLGSLGMYGFMIFGAGFMINDHKHRPLQPTKK